MGEEVEETGKGTWGGAQEAPSLESKLTPGCPNRPVPSLCPLSLFHALPQLPVKCSEAPSGFSWTMGETHAGPRSVQDRPPHRGPGQVHLGI